jgi:chromosome segregation ATPase
MKTLKHESGKFEKEMEADQLKRTAALNSVVLQSSVLQGEVEKFDGRVLLLANEVAIMREEQGEYLTDAKKETALIASLSKQLAESKKAISSIDASRVQLNERVVSMERSINKLQLNIKNTAQTADVQ